MATSKYDQAEAYRKAKQYDQALPLFRELWITQPTPLIAWRLLECLRKTGLLKEAEEFADKLTAQFPDDLFVQKQVAWTYADVERYADAVNIFESLWKKGFDSYIVTHYIKCLRKVGRLDDAEKLSRQALEQNANDAYVKKELGWVLYEKLLKPAKEDIDLDAIVEAAEEITGLCQDDMLLARTVLSVMKVAKDKNNGNWTAVLDWSERLKPDQLDIEMRQINGKRAMSDRETFYISRTKALFKLRRYQEAAEYAQLGLLDFGHSLFLARLDALSHAEMNDVPYALEKMRQLQNHPRCDWYVMADLAELELRTGNLDEAYRLMCGALKSSRQDAEFKIGYFVTLADTAVKLGKIDVAAAHLKLARTIREQHGWRLPTDLVQLERDIERLLEQHRDLPQLPDEEEELLRICRKEWNRISAAGQGATLLGTVQLVQDPNAVYAFIQPSDGSKRVYVRIQELPRDYKEGMTVEYSTKPKFDKKRGEMSVEAINVRRAK